MNILITNCVMDSYSGTSVVVRDLACELHRQGHKPMVYSPKLGPIALEIRNRGIEVTDDLARLSAMPDIIHGQHGFQTAEALVHYPSLPAIYVCHDATYAMDDPFDFPRILRYVAVDERCRKRIAENKNIPGSRIAVIWNSVDLTRFTPREALPAHPRRALVFSNNASRFTHLPAIRSACAMAGLQLNAIGLMEGGQVHNPETVLGAYDIVFAKARCALEAMAAGTAVILCDFGGSGPMVTTSNFDRLRPMNFGRGALDKPLNAGLLRNEIERYDAADAAVICGKVQREADLVEATRQVCGALKKVLREFGAAAWDSNHNFLALNIYRRQSRKKRHCDGGALGWDSSQVSPFIGKAYSRFLRAVILKKH